jgi:DNA ligase 1
MNNSRKAIILAGFPLEISVDNFKPAQRSLSSQAYFLTHFHSDHYGGLDSTFPWMQDETKKLYCSTITSALVKNILAIPANRIISLEFGITFKIQFKTSIELLVTMIPANHCPGAAQILFEYQDPLTKKIKRVLHCGDCRFDSSMKLNEALLEAKKGGGIDELFLDTTYAKAKHVFPSQSQSINMALQIVSECMTPDSVSLTNNLLFKDLSKDNASYAISDADKSAATTTTTTTKSSIPSSIISSSAAIPFADTDKVLILISTYNVGKERLILSIARTFGLRIYAPPRRIKTLSLLGINETDMKYFTTDRSKASIHIVSMGFLASTFPYIMPNFDNLNHYLESMNKQLKSSSYLGHDTDDDAITFISGAQSNQSIVPESSKRYNRIFGILPTGWCESLKEVKDKTSTTSLYTIPYSEHSSYSELHEYVSFLKPVLITPTVFSDEKDFIRIRNDFAKDTNQTEAKRSFISLFSKKSSSSSSKNVVTIVDDDDVIEVVEVEPKKRKIVQTKLQSWFT